MFNTLSIEGGHVILKEKLKLLNTSINSIFGITNLIYFRDIWKMHLLSSDKISFSVAIWPKCLEHSVVFLVILFWSNLHHMFPLLHFSWNSRVWNFFSSIFFFYQGFFSRTLTTHRTAGEGRRPFSIPLYHLHPLTNIQAFICNFACEMTITYF